MWHLLIFYSFFQLVSGGGNSIPGWNSPSFILISSDSSENFVIFENEIFENNKKEEVTKRPRLGHVTRRVESEFSKPDLSSPSRSAVNSKASHHEASKSFTIDNENELIQQETFNEEDSNPSKIHTKSSSISNSESKSINNGKNNAVNDIKELRKSLKQHDSRSKSSDQEVQNSNVNSSKDYDENYQDITTKKPRSESSKPTVSSSRASTTESKEENEENDFSSRSDFETFFSMGSQSRKIMRRLVPKPKSSE